MSYDTATQIFARELDGLLWNTSEPAYHARLPATAALPPDFFLSVATITQRGAGPCRPL